MQKVIKDKSKTKMVLKRTLQLCMFGFIVLLLWTGYVQWIIHSVEKSELPEKSDVGIVLGAALWNDVPSPALRERLHKAEVLYREGYFPKIIVSGGMGHSSSTVTEAEGMKRYLVEQGIPEDDILLENEAHSTYENLLFSRDVMKENELNSAVIITHTYHGARALNVASFLDYHEPVAATMDSTVMWMPYHKGRETLAYGKWLLDKTLIRTGVK
jgi:uncharacterized SAM-binding protein YcdF (DUF218 family)